MNYRSKYQLSFVLAGLALIGASKGVAMVASEGIGGGSMVPGMIMLLASVAVGCGAAIMRNYYKSHKDDGSEQQRIAVQTLSKLGEQQKAEREQTLKQKLRESK